MMIAEMQTKATDPRTAANKVVFTGAGRGGDLGGDVEKLIEWDVSSETLSSSSSSPLEKLVPMPDG